MLDNAFDGLDVPSRTALAELISLTLKGFSQLLVQGVDASATAHTQVLLITHRAEEIVDGISTVSCMALPDPAGTGGSIVTTHERSPMTTQQLMEMAMGCGHGGVHRPCSVLPTHGELTAVLGARGTPGTVLVEASGLRVRRCAGESEHQPSVASGAEPVVLLQDLDWSVRRGEHWLIAGGNGAGKSTLSALLARTDPESVGASGALNVLGQGIGASSVASEAARTHGGLALRDGVGWVSTEIHLRLARSSMDAWSMLSRTGGDNVAFSMVRWLGLTADALYRPFSALSQGEQKLVLIGAAVAQRPTLLVLDEPCQGLDLLSRSRVLSLVDRVCTSTDTTLIYITHHYEEVMPCISHVMHLRGGNVVFSGERAAYELSDSYRNGL